MPSMAGIPAHHLAMTLKSGGLSPFLPLLQSGVRVACRPGVTLEELLVQQWGIDADYLSRRITTLFLNSRVVDSVATSVVHGGATVALSGAMPGLVGATMRRGGYYAAMRGAMSYRHDGAGSGTTLAWVRVKLFNLLLGELGPGFLARGIVMTATELGSFIAAGAIAAENFTRLPALDGRSLPPAGLVAALAPLGDGELMLTVEFEDLP
jgi:hypothetical protein